MLALSPCSHLISILTYLALACTCRLFCRAGTIICNPLGATDLLDANNLHLLKAAKATMQGRMWPHGDMEGAFHVPRQ